MAAEQSSMTTRRRFLAGAGLAACGSSLRSAGLEAKLDRISVLSWSFHTLWERGSSAASPWNILDYPELLAHRYGIHNVEVQDTNFDSTEPSYFQEFKKRLTRVHSRLVNMALELDKHGNPPRISSPDPEVRERAVELTKQWTDHAANLGCPSVMVNQGSNLTAEDVPVTVDALRTLVAYGKPRNVVITMENRGRTNPDLLAQMMRASGSFANPDIGNFPDDATRARSLPELFPLAHHMCHVKMNPEKYDVTKYIRLSKDLGYKGLYSIEAGTDRKRDPYADVQSILDVLLRDL